MSDRPVRAEGWCVPTTGWTDDRCGPVPVDPARSGVVRVDGWGPVAGRARYRYVSAPAIISAWSARSSGVGASSPVSRGRQ